MKKILSLFVYLLLLFVLRAAPEDAAAPASLSAPLPDGVQKTVALTFDDGPKRATTETLLDGLRERNVPATFFVLGAELAGNEDLILRMRDEGHQIGNHTWDHVRLDGSAPASQLRQLARTEEALKEITGQSDFWVRPPYGVVGKAVQDGVSVPLVKWSVDPRDWETRDAASVVRAVLSEVQSGDIVLLHDIYPTSVDAALQLVDALRAQGYTFVTVKDLLYTLPEPPAAGVVYRYAD
ncbi:MAG: polysaccharide deacetylase family protein [Oscillibacter sp.]|nr:polysaccharide deacetylase family protein [Oscillibacter sp.]